MAKKWGIKVNGKWWIQGAKPGKPYIYDKHGDAIKDAQEFNSMRKKGDNPYSVEEYKK